MDLREELQPRHRAPSDLVRIRELLFLVEDLLEQGQAADDEIAEFNLLVAGRYDARFFLTYNASRSADDVVRELSLLPPSRVAGITRDELLEIVRRAMPGAAGGRLEYRAYYARLLDVNVSYPDASNLIYYPPEGWDGAAGWDPSPEEIVQILEGYSAHEG